MDKDSQELDLQLNNDAPDGESYSLEDIMREFGGWTKQEEEPAAEPEPEPEQPNEPEQPPQPEHPGVMRVAADKPEPDKQPKFKLVDLTGDTVRFKPVAEEVPEPEPVRRTPPVEMPEEPEPDAADERELRKARKREAKRQRRLANQRKKALRAQRRAQKRAEPEVVYLSPEEACAAYAKGGSLRLRTLISCLLTLASAALLVLSSCFSSLVTLSASMTQAQILDAFANAAAAVWRMPLFWVSVLLALLGCAAALCRCYQYRMSLYFVLDQGLSSLAALRASKAAIRGNRRALFLLDLRFLPYLFLLFLPQLLSQLQSYEILQLSFAGPQSLLIYNLIVTCYAIAICTWQTPLYTAAQAHAYTEIIRSAPQDFEFPGR